MFCPVCRSDYADDWKVCPKDAAVLLRSQFIGKYRIDQQIGAGGMGAVYRAYNPDTQSTVAIKLMHGGNNAIDAARQRFQREAASIAALRTRHVVSIYDFGADADGTLYLVMEYLQGHPLRNEIAPFPNVVPLARVHFIFDNALRGLQAAHKASIVHRDLKPENLFVANTDDGEVIKILDFGIARVQQADTPNLTNSGALMGTPAYMAPEQVAGNRGQIGAHSDVYAMGVILYEMLAGQSPFHAETLSEVLSKILARTFLPLAQVRPDLPPAIAQLFERSIADDPKARFADAGALREAWMAAWSLMPPEQRSMPVPPFVDRRPGAVSARPGVGMATDVPSAPTALPPGMMAELTDRSTPGLSPSARRGVALAPTYDPGQSVTPGPVVVSTGGTEMVQRPAKKSNAALFAVLGVLLVGGGVAAFLATRGGSKDADPTPDPTPDPHGVAKLDAARVVVATPIDAAVAVVEGDVQPTVPDGMARIAGGTFAMGTPKTAYKDIPNADAAHDVTVKDFYLDVREVTAEGSDLPMAKVIWADAQKICADRGKRLPTAAEWERAATASKLDPKQANLKTKKSAPAAVGSHPGDCTSDGVCDLLGNVMEWTADRWPGDESKIVVRGASYGISPGAGWYASVHARLNWAPDAPEAEIGFRCAQDAP